MQFKNGSILEVSPNDYPLIIHYGILVNYGGEWWVLHNNQHNGVHREKLKTVLERSKILRVVDSPFTGKTTDFLLERFKKFEGRNYDLVQYNCETFVNEFLSGKRFSNQTIIYTGITLVIVILITAWITTKIIR